MKKIKTKNGQKPKGTWQKNSKVTLQREPREPLTTRGKVMSTVLILLGIAFLLFSLTH